MTAQQELPRQTEPASPRSLVLEDPALASRYQAYRRRQAAALVSLVPREAVRPLYARARDWARARGREAGKDPLETLVRFLEGVLPLPPLEIWMEDRAAFLEAHLEEEFVSAPAHRRAAPPVTVESRGMEWMGRRWQASLSIFREEEAWKGFVAFRPSDGAEAVRTADVFRADDPEEIRDRFLSFHSQTLQAFLRSVLP